MGQSNHWGDTMDLEPVMLMIMMVYIFEEWWHIPHTSRPIHGAIAYQISLNLDQWKFHLTGHLFVYN